MNPKLVLFASLLLLGAAVEAKDFMKKLSQKKLAFAPTTAERALGHIRHKRDTASSEEMTDEEAAALMKFFVAVGWEANKLEFLADFLEDMADHETNLTVVGWQRVVGDDGAVKEETIVQLVIPPKPEGGEKVDLDLDEDEDEEDDDRLVPYGKISEMREAFEPFAQVGIPISITMESYDKHGDEPELIFLDKDELYLYFSDIAIYNKTAYVPADQVEAFIKKQPETLFGKPAVLHYNVDGQFVEEKSHVTPYLLGSVSDFYEAPDEVIFQSPNIISDVISRHHRYEIPKELAVKYNEKFPEYTWRVLVDPENYYVTRDVSVTVSYDNFDLDENSDVEYVVFGVKKAK